jgi:hypothetical protein
MIALPRSFLTPLASELRNQFATSGMICHETGSQSREDAFKNAL